ncbi:hypothetical protein TW81_13315 [Vibrio galatheae]|uniref:DUF3306 domain-containing protein n=1 Tax=Vibrio galatheae TaxID=579748 RepID=A0A0F4NHQ2_9VIBR|nr:DUF3306 domain-containing protein [Vibrio galatheae]KJY82388.1 hypothetical protein TW81_13315 [Vibrio galatheae]
MATKFLNRWSQRKLGADELEHDRQQDKSSDPKESTNNDLVEPAAEPSDQDNRPQTSQPPSSIAALLASQAKSEVKKAALRKLFLSGEFSEIDGLNDYDHDYKSVKSLSTEVVEKLRDWMNSEQDSANKNQSSTQDVTVDASELDPCTSVSELTSSENEHKSVRQNIPHKS